METPRIEYYSRMAKGLILLGDLLIVDTLFYLFYLWASSLGRHPELRATLPQTLLVISFCYAGFLARWGVVAHRRGLHAYQVVTRVFRNVFLFAVLSGVVLECGDFMRVLTPFYLAYVTILFGIISAYRLTFRWLLKRYRQRGGNLRHAVLVGSEDSNLELYHELTDDTTFGYRVHGYFDHVSRADFPVSCPYLGTPDEVRDYLANHPLIDRLYCGLSSREQATILSIIDYCENHLVHFYNVPSVRNYLHNRMYMSLVGNVPVLSLRQVPLNRTENRVLKRAFDLVFSGFFLCTLFPLIFLLVAVGIKLTMPGPVFFRQKRNGLNDREFYCLKFRSMRVNKDSDKIQATRDDPRKTRFGNFLRSTSLDEIPQFLNVLLGDMSVVGPRPHMLRHTEEYSRLIDKYMVRHFVKPGITGWSQVTGYRGETRELREMEGRVKGDIWYIEHWSFWLDMQIIYKTVMNAVRGEEKAY